MGMKLNLVPIKLDYKKIGKIIILLIINKLISTNKIKYKLNWLNIQKLSCVFTNLIE